MEHSYYIIVIRYNNHKYYLSHSLSKKPVTEDIREARHFLCFYRATQALHAYVPYELKEFAVIEEYSK